MIRSYIIENNKVWQRGHIDKFWSDRSFSDLEYVKNPFNNSDDVNLWKQQGYNYPDTYFTGLMCDMSKQQPDWNKDIIKWVEESFKLKDIGTTYYKMSTGTILPVHRDTFIKYRSIFDTTIDKCFRIIVFLKDWKSGHYFEIDNTPILSWEAGDYVMWNADTEHMAANIGIEDRYTLQITGHI
jgi:hypothetical protein